MWQKKRHATVHLMKIYYWHDKLFFIWFDTCFWAQPRNLFCTPDKKNLPMVFLLSLWWCYCWRAIQVRWEFINLITMKVIWLHNEIKALWYSLREHDPYNFLNCCCKNIHLSGRYFLPAKSTAQLLQVAPCVLTCEILSSSPKLFPHLLWEAKWRPSEKKNK